MEPNLGKCVTCIISNSNMTMPLKLLSLTKDFQRALCTKKSPRANSSLTEMNNR